MKRRLACAAVAAALLWLPALAGEPLEPPDLSRYLRWGPLRVRPGVVLSNLGYDDNVFYRTGAQDKVGDYTATISPKLEGVALFGHRAFLTFSEQLDFVLYKTYRGQDFINQLGSARVTFPFRRFGVFADAGLNIVKERPIDQFDLRPERRETKFGGGVIVPFGWRTDVEAGGWSTRYRYRDPDSSAVYPDRTERTSRVKLRYLVFGRTRLTLGVQQGDIRFEKSADDRDATQWTVLPGVEFGEGGRLSGSLRVGRSRLNMKAQEKPDFSGTVGEAALAYRFGAGTTLEAKWKREAAFAVYEDYYLSNSYEGKIVQYFNRLIGAEASTGIWSTSFPDSLRRDRILQYGAGIRLRLSQNDLGRRVEYSLKVTRWRLNSSPAEFDYLDQSHSTVGITATLGY